MLLLALSLLVQSPAPVHDSLLANLLAAEDGRAATAAHLATLTGALTHRDTLIQRIAVRGLGRLERPELLGRIASALGGTAASVRIEAANAVAQALYRVDGGPALVLFRSRVAAENAPVVRGAVLAALGRLRLAAGSAGAREAALMLGDGVSSDGAHLDGALRGMWDFLRRQGRTPTATPATVAQLRRRTANPGVGEGRRLALMSLLLVEAADSAILGTSLRAPDTQLRRIAASGLRTAANLPGRNALIRVALVDPATMVRIEGVRAWAAHGRTTEGCEPLVAAVRDSMITVQLLAIDGLGQGCGPVRAPVDLLAAIAAEPLAPGRWHRPVRALQALALADSGRAAIRLAGFAGSPIWWVRMHAAAAAQRLGDRSLLRRLAGDSVDNVREAALRALVAIEGHGADSTAVRQLTRPDYQLVLTAARALRNADLGPGDYALAWAALRRISAEGKETSRDTRLALLDLLERNPGDSGQRTLLPWLADFDRAVAERAAAIVQARGEGPVTAAPRPRPPLPLPSPEELRGMREAIIVLRGGDRLVLRLRAAEAPTNVARFVGMARAGWFNGLTLHRVVPNFVLQGGSPGANEYAGGAEFSRDEVGGSHRRGTIGISTRGRDTGDGQLFINLVDNLNLDHEYTVIGDVVEGGPLLESVQEGRVIERIELPGGKVRE